MRFVAAVLALAGTSLGQTLSFGLLPESVDDTTIPAARDGRLISIESRSIQFRSPTQDGNYLRELVLFREPETGQVISLVRLLQSRFGTYAAAGDIRQNTAISIDKGVMRAFFFLGYSLLVSESKTRAANLDEAQNGALAEFADQPFSGMVAWAPGEHWIRLLERLPKSIAEHVGDVRSPSTRLRGLARSKGCWSMAVEGPDAESTSVFVDDNYDLTGVEECAKPTPKVAHVSLPSPEAKLQVAAHRDNQPVTLEVRSVLARVRFPDGQPGRLHLFMLYDQPPNSSGGRTGRFIPRSRTRCFREIARAFPAFGRS
jgi:hypothetical protein